MLARDWVEAAWRGLGGAVARRLFLERQALFWARSRSGRWSPGEMRARVVDVKDETGDTKTFVLEPEAGWHGHRAGQFITLVLEIDGVRLRRCYSLSSAPSDRTLQITVKRAVAGRVSRWLHDHVRRGHVLRISAAAGEFVLPDPMAARLLFVTGGSGITPVMSMLRDLDRRGVVGDVVLVHYARSRRDVIFGTELEALAERHAGLRVCLGLSDATDRQERFDEARLAALVPDFAERATYLCGPPGLMARVERMWERAGATGQLRRERFGAPSAVTLPAVKDGPARGLAERSRQILLLRSGRTHTLGGERTLLDELERVGEQPRHGCRIGICHTCQCRKRSGTVRNVLTGAVSSEPDQDIQLCISIACSDLELGL